MVLEKVLDIFFGVKIKPVFQAHPCKGLPHLLLGEEVNLLGLLRVTLLVQAYKLNEKVLTNLHQRQRHVKFALELRMHRQKGCSIELLDGRHKDNLDVFPGQEVEVPQVKLGRNTVNEEFLTNLLEIGLAVRLLSLGQLRRLKADFLIRATLVKHLHINWFRGR